MDQFDFKTIEFVQNLVCNWLYLTKRKKKVPTSMNIYQLDINSSRKSNQIILLILLTLINELKSLLCSTSLFIPLTLFNKGKNQ